MFALRRALFAALLVSLSMTASAAPYFVWQRNVADTSGNVIASATVTVRDSVTSSLVQLYSDVDGATPLGNPVTADSSGFVRFYVGEGRYDVIVTSGAFTRTWEDERLGVDAGELTYATTAAELTAGVTIEDAQYPEGWVLRYGADPTGVSNSQPAIQAAVDVAEAKTNGGSVYLPDGVYRVTSTVTVAGNRVHIYGNGPDATRVTFAPSGDDVLFDFDLGGTSLTQASLKHLAIWSTDSTNTKTAIRLEDVSEFDLHDVTILGSVDVDSANMWSGDDSIGLQVFGRQTLSARDLHIQADRPIVLGINPNTFIDADHFNFHNLYWVANDNPGIEVLEGVSLSNVSFTGYQAWVRGTSGFSYVNTTALGFNPYKLRFENVRGEQGTDASAYLFDVSTTTGYIDDLQIINAYLDIERDGIRTNGVMQIQLDGVSYPSTTGEGLTVTGVVSGARRTTLDMRSSYWQTTSTATLTSMRLAQSRIQRGGTTQPLPSDALYEYDNTSVARDMTVPYALAGETFSLADTAVAAISPTALGLLVVVDGVGGTCLFALNGTSNDTDEIADADSICSGTAGTGSSQNVYWDAGDSRYEIQNNRGAGTLTYKLTMLGSYSDF
jgi:hypothetical protein